MGRDIMDVLQVRQATRRKVAVEVYPERNYIPSRCVSSVRAQPLAELRSRSSASRCGSPSKACCCVEPECTRLVFCFDSKIKRSHKPPTQSVEVLTSLLKFVSLRKFFTRLQGNARYVTLAHADEALPAAPF